MGTKPSSETNNQYSRLIADFEVIQQSKNQGLRYLQSKISKQQFLLREISCHDSEAFKKTETVLKDRQKQLSDNRHIVPLAKLISSQHEQYCMSYFKIYTIWQFPQRTLEDQINERVLQKRKFQQKELWSILASCILALSHLQKEDIKHCSLKSAAILISPDGIVKLYDPITTGAVPNYQTLLTHRSTPHLYICPEQAESLNEEKSSPSCDPFKADIWTLGMILLEAGLLSYQDQCYKDQFSRIKWDTLQFNISKFQQVYSPQLSHLLEFMLAKDERGRPDWAELQEHVIKVQEDARGSCISQPSNQQHQNSVDKVFKQVSTNANKGQKKDLSVFFQKKPISSSRVEQNPDEALMVSRAEKSSFKSAAPAIFMKPSDISCTRPLRNIFPANSYTTVTVVDENLLHQNITNNSQNQQSSPLLIDHSKLNESKSRLQSFSKQQGQYVRQLYIQGSRYEGYKVKGLKHGFGKFYYQDGGMYEGNWDEGKMTGFGKLYYQSNQLAYQGQWLNDQFYGKGILYNQDPQSLRRSFNYRNFDEIQEFWIKYQGDFVEDMKHGRGILYLSNGEFFEGEFRNDYVNGYGTFVTQRGVRIQGFWQSNLMQ